MRIASRSRARKFWVALGGLAGIITIIIGIIQILQSEREAISDTENFATQVALQMEQINVLKEIATLQAVDVQAGPTATFVAEQIPQLQSTEIALEKRIDELTLVSTEERSANAENTNTSPGSSSDEWYVRAYNTDDANIILVNGHIVGGAYYRGTIEWININGWLRSDGKNYVAFVNLNGPQTGVWGFSLRQNDTIIWGNEGSAQLG
jgi:hypothetical protein